MIKKKKVTQADIKDLKSFIENMQVNIYYEMPSTFSYKWIVIEHEFSSFSKQWEYCWGMEYNYDATCMVGYIHPLKSSGNYVQKFKTEKGAKKNLITRLSKK